VGDGLAQLSPPTFTREFGVLSGPARASFGLGA
jgi:hypothetical protein